MGFPGGLVVKIPQLQEMQEMWVQFLDWEDLLEEEEMATNSSILVWEISWTEEPGGLQLEGVINSETQLSISSIFRNYQI